MAPTSAPARSATLVATTTKAAVTAILVASAIQNIRSISAQTPAGHLSAFLLHGTGRSPERLLSETDIARRALDLRPVLLIVDFGDADFDPVRSLPVATRMRKLACDHAIAPDV